MEVVMHGVTLDGTKLTVERIAALAAAPEPLALSDIAWDRIRRGRAIVDAHLASGTPIYGATTGIGSQKDVAVASEALADFSNRMIISEATDYPGPAFPEPVVRAALVVLLNNVASGRSGIRPELAERLLQLYATTRLPTVRADTSNGVADLTPLAQLGLAILGRSLAGEAPALAGSFALAPKESLSLIDNNAFALGHGALLLTEVERLLAAFDLAGATALEGLRGDLRAQLASAAGGWRGVGQARSRDAVLAALDGSALHHPGAARFLQDPMSFRSITQIHGAAYEAWAWAKTHVEAEINSATDNPLVDLERGELFATASMASLLPALSIDCLRQALAKVAIQSFERGLKLQSAPFTGLPVGLAADGAADGGIISINLHYIGSARLATLTAAAAPVLLLYAGQLSDSVEDISSLTPLSVTQTQTVVDRAWEIAALELAVGVWAIARRGIARTELGRGTREVHDALRPLLHIGEEGRRIFDMAAIVRIVRDGKLLAARGEVA
jgi:histidine ammonia-lyase